MTIASNPAAPLSGPTNLAIDTSGDLWVANQTSSTVMEYKTTQLTASGDPLPAVIISSTGTSLTHPSGLGFDASGDLWVATSTNGNVVEYTPTQLAASGHPAPAVTISTAETRWGLAFDGTGDLWTTSSAGQVSEYTPAQLATSGHPAPAVTIKGATTGLTSPAGLAIKQPPTLTSLSPATGPERGGTTVTVHGAGFTSATKVSFGGAAATTVKVVSPFTLTAVVPKGLQTVTVTVSTFAGTSAASAGSKFTYVGTGYELVGSDGGVFVFPTGMPHGYYGSLPGIGVVPNKPVAGMVPTTTDSGYFLVAQDGGVFAFGTAPFLGSLPGIHVTPVAPIVGIVAVDTDHGYLLVGQDGGVFSFANRYIPTFGSLPGLGIHVDNIVGMAATPSGNGYWLVSATGTVYAFGAAQALGTAKGTPSPVSAIAGTATGGGYWITTQNGAVYAFGSAKKVSPGTLPAIGVTPAHPVIGIVPTANTAAYWLLGSDGGIFSFSPPGFTLFYGSLPGLGVQVTNIVAAVAN
ncbi:MAG: IPT/TIG domain-containing protein [Acidimicrobiales bacterium]